MYPFFILILALAFTRPPVNPEYVESVMALDIIHHETEAECAGAVGYYVPGEIHLCGLTWGGGGIRYLRVVAHEIQHHYQSSYLVTPNMADLTEGNWGEFLRICAAKVPNVTLAHACEDPRLSYARLIEIHAEIPAVLGFDMPTELQPWYPWLVLSESSGVAASQEDAAWSVGQ